MGPQLLSLCVFVYKIPSLVVVVAVVDLSFYLDLYLFCLSKAMPCHALQCINVANAVAIISENIHANHGKYCKMNIAKLNNILQVMPMPMPSSSSSTSSMSTQIHSLSRLLACSLIHFIQIVSFRCECREWLLASSLSKLHKTPKMQTHWHRSINCAMNGISSVFYKPKDVV